METLEQARTRIRRGVGPGYSGVLHFAFINAFALGCVAFALSRVHRPGAALFTVPITFLYANLVEWFAHRGPMHRRVRGLGLVYRRHALDHHSFFTADAMQAEGTRDFKMVLFPAWLVAFFFASFALPTGLLLAALLGPDVGWLFGATAMAYFLLYEWLHLAYHHPRWGALPIVSSLRRHHAAHHDPRAMSHANFNITFPICDALFGTWKK